jgi:predicted nucleic-acid-binding protein
VKAADTNVLARVITGDDEAQVRDAEAWLASGAWISSLVLVELSWVLSSAYAFPKAEAARALEAVLSLPGVSVEDEATVRAALATWRTARGDVDFADCMILHVAARAGHGPLGTFDGDLAKLSGTERLGRKRPRRT